MADNKPPEPQNFPSGVSARPCRSSRGPRPPMACRPRAERVRHACPRSRRNGPARPGNGIQGEEMEEARKPWNPRWRSWKRLNEEREKAMLATLRSKRNPRSPPSETSIPIFRTRSARAPRTGTGRRPRRGEARATEMERRLMEERETWVSTLKTKCPRRIWNPTSWRMVSPKGWWNSNGAGSDENPLEQSLRTRPKSWKNSARPRPADQQAELQAEKQLVALTSERDTLSRSSPKSKNNGTGTPGPHKDVDQKDRSSSCSSQPRHGGHAAPDGEPAIAERVGTTVLQA